MTKNLFVFFDQKLMGRLHRLDDGRFEFQYEDSWLQSKSSFPISLALPLQAGRFSSRLTRSYFENLLPEGETLERIRESSEEHFANEFDFLETHGQDCAGAFVITADPTFIKNQDPKARKKLDLGKVYKAWRQKKGLMEFLMEEDEHFFSLAGAQDKIPVLFEKGECFIPLKGGATSHIIKSPVRHWENTQDSVYNEHFCMKLAKAIGLHTAECEILEGEIPLFITKRYDRETQGKHITRLHQIDFCQAQGYLSDEKYEINGGPSFQKNYELLKELPNSNVKNMQQLLEWLFFNFYIGNHDNHSKNLSLLLQNEKWSLSPFYDLLSTAIYPQIKRKLAFKIGGQREWKKISAKQLPQQDLELKLRKGTSLSVAEKVKKKIDSRFHQILSEHQKDFPQIDTFSKIEQVFQERKDALT